MKFTSAFAALGYNLKSPRTDWSADRENGVCLSLWAKEIKFKDSGCSFDTRWDAQHIETWNHKPGFRRRLEHLGKAYDQFGGRIDVVIVSGTPGGSYEDAHPWKLEQRKGTGWFVTEFDPQTGHFAVETKPA